MDETPSTLYVKACCNLLVGYHTDEPRKGNLQGEKWKLVRCDREPKDQLLKCPCVGSRGLATKENLCFDNMALLRILWMPSIGNARHSRVYEASIQQVGEP